MATVAQRTGATALALALLAACGGKGSPPSPLELSCSVSSSGPEPVLTVLGRARTSAAAGTPAITVTMDLQPSTRTFTLDGQGWSGSAEIRGAAVRAGQGLVGRASVDGKEAVGTCVATGGLPALTARADRTPAGAVIGWNAVAGAATYRWRLLDGPGGTELDAGTTTGTSAQATTAATFDPTDPWLAEVGAYAITGDETSYPVPLPAPGTSFGRALFTAGRGGGDGVTAWQLFGPGDYLGSTLTASFPALASGERLAVLLVNAGGDDMGFATVSAVGTGSPSAPAATAAPLQSTAARAGSAEAGGADRSDVLAGEALVSAWREETIARLRDGRLPRAGAADRSGEPLRALAAAPLPPTRSFCQGQFSGTSFKHLWIRATLALETAHAAFYQADGVKPGIDAALAARPDFWTSLGAAYEDRILPALHASFGTESDLDGNGKMIFLVGNLGQSGRAFPVGFFWPGDLELPQASAASCPRNDVGNRADVLYLTDPGTFTTLWSYKGTYDQVLGLVLDGEYPSTMAHELQHQINYNTRFPPGGAWGVDEELWLNEGLSMLAETVAGYGLRTSTGRSNVRNYQGTATSGQPYYQGYGMTLWEGDPYGNYAGAQAFMQYLRDHASPAMTRSLVNKWLTGKANLEAATGVPWELGFARFATAAMFSNEDRAEPNGAAGTITSSGDLLANPIFNYLGSGSPGLPAAGDYVPWHHYTDSCSGVPRARAAHVAWTPLLDSANAALRQDGWAAFATGPGANGPATITVQSSATVRPHVVVVKHQGALPNFAPPTCL